ncbi:MAG: hypothetical protein WCJ58_07360 [bacterium]
MPEIADEYHLPWDQLDGIARIVQGGSAGSFGNRYFPELIKEGEEGLTYGLGDKLTIPNICNTKIASLDLSDKTHLIKLADATFNINRWRPGSEGLEAQSHLGLFSILLEEFVQSTLLNLSTLYWGDLGFPIEEVIADHLLSKFTIGDIQNRLKTMEAHFSLDETLNIVDRIGETLPLEIIMIPLNEVRTEFERTKPELGPLISKILSPALDLAWKAKNYYGFIHSVTFQQIVREMLNTDQLDNFENINRFKDRFQNCIKEIIESGTTQKQLIEGLKTFHLEEKSGK